jgi:GNAT superfamily N-acetyltransferase
MLILPSANNLLCDALHTITYRSGTYDDVAHARRILIQQKMNPFSIKPENMIVADVVTGNDDDSKNKNTDNKSASVVGFGQIRQLSSSSNPNKLFFELASLYVAPSYRRQGIATNIIQQLLERIDDNSSNAYGDNSSNAYGDNSSSSSAKTTTTTTTTTTKVCCLLTLKETSPIYARQGFQIVQETSTLPQQIQLEAAAGSIISKFLSNTLVCMTRVIS